jgi:hypothetical protein
MKHFIYGLLLISSMAACSQAFAWDCSVWSSNVPGMECYKAPASPSTSNSNANNNTSTSASKAKANSSSHSSASSNASQSQQQAQTQAQGQTASASNAGNAQTSNYTTERQAPSVAQGALLIQGCGAGGNAGGSNTRGAAFAGVAWTPKECYAFMLAQAYQSVGQSQAACEVLRTTDAAKRARERGMPEIACGAAQAEQRVAVRSYTPEQVDAIVRKTLNK